MFSDCGLVKRQATDPSGVMVLFEVTHGLRLSMASGGGRLQCMDRVVQNALLPIGPREIDQPPPPFGTLLPATGAGIQVRLWPPFST